MVGAQLVRDELEVEIESFGMVAKAEVSEGHGVAE